MAFAKSHCKHGHDISLAGRTLSNGTCRQCQRLLKAKYYQLNKKRLNDRTKTRQKANPEKVRQWRRNSRRKHPDRERQKHLRREYGMTLKQYQELLAQQKNQCACCGQPVQKPVVDHDHITGQIRGLLCSRCNLGIGQLADDPILIRKTARYIESHRQQSLALEVH